MPHLHLPAEHSEADIVLAANLAELVGSDDLFVAWTHDSGAGAIPEIDAFVRDEPRRGLATLLMDIAAGVAAFWHSLLRSPVAAQPTPGQRAPDATV